MSARLAYLGVVATLVLGGSAESAPLDNELVSRVEGLLGSYRTVTVAEWRAVGPEAGPVLETVARDPRALPTRRARALAALGVVRPDAAAPLIRELASDATVAPVLRSAAVDAAPGVLGADAPHLLVPLLRDPAARVRRHSALALVSTGPAGCRVVLTEAMGRPHSDPVAKAAGSCAARLRGGNSPDR